MVTYDFEVVESNTTKGPPANLESGKTFGEYEYVILRLSENLEANKHKLFSDNLFSSPELMVYLRSKGIFAVGTFCADRTRGCPLPTERAMKKKGRGEMSQFVAKKEKIVMCAW